MSKYNKEKSREYYLLNKERIAKYSIWYQKKRIEEDSTGYYKKLRIRVKKWRENNPEKNKAHKKVFVELRAGRMTKGKCFCGETKVEAHHEDYSKPLDVIWLCKKHHIEADNLRKQLSPVIHR